MNRRTLLKTLALAGGGVLLPVGRSGWAATGAALPAQKRLIVVMLRGAVDGLSVVVPCGDADYYHARSTIAIARPGADGGALDLDGYFGLHPALSPLMPLWQQQRLAFVHATGSPDPTRSHFDAQDYMESGTPGRKITADGWMNRLLTQLPATHSPTQALSLGPVLPRILSGAADVANMPLGRNAGKDIAFDKPQVAAVFDRLYAGNDSLSQAYREGRAARTQIRASMQDLDDAQQEMRAADNGAPSPKGFVLDAYQLAGLIQRDPGIQLAFVALGGWDTHVNQGNAKGQLAGHLEPLAQGLSALAGGLGSMLDDTVIVVMSEFGRTVKQNGNNGTDHGHGNVMWLIGGEVRGGKIHGDWPTLAPQRLHENRDLAITTDFRSVLAQVLEHHLRLDDARLAAVLPDAPLKPGAPGGLFSA
jgi:uncharacterized protein (DUF1501 family)